MIREYANLFCRSVNKFYVLSFFCLLSSNVAHAEILKAIEIVDKYTANQDKMKSLIARTESVWIPSAESTTEQQLKQNRNKSIVEFRYEDTGKDFKAYFCRTPLKMESDGTWIEENASRSTKLLWYDKRYYRYYKGPRLAVSNLRVTADLKYAGKELSEIAYDGVGPFRGFLCGDCERIDTILRQSDFLSVRPDLDQVGSVKCYVVDAVSRHGTYTIWFDPEHGYGIAKAIVHKGPEDLRWGRPLSFYTNPIVNSTYVMQNVRFERVNDIWFPMEFEWLSTNEREGKTQSGRTPYKVTHLDVNPDHNDLGSFSLDGLDIQNGTRVKIAEAPGISYTWQNGKIMSSVDEYVIEEIDKITDEIMNEDDIRPASVAIDNTAVSDNEPNAVVDTQADSIESLPKVLSESRSWPLLVSILIGLLIIGIVGWQVFSRLKTKEQ